MKRFPHAVVSALLLAACAQQPITSSVTPVETAACPVCAPCPVCPPLSKPAEPPPPAEPYTAVDWAALPGWQQDDVSAAWAPFLASCKLVREPIWKPVCEAAVALGTQPGSGPVRSFFQTWLAPWQVVNADGSRDGLITGYYEPLIRGARQRSASYRYPVYAVPDDMVTVDLGALYPELKNLRLRGRVVGRKLLPYWSRAEFGQLEAQGQPPARVLLWAQDALDLFFLQVQGSGQVQLAEGGRVRLAYADQNGHPYVSIGRWLVQHEGLRPEQAGLEGIKAWARANPQRLDELLNANPSYVFFSEEAARAEGPRGAQGLALTAGRSIAVDPRSVPLGSPVFLATTWPSEAQPLQRLMLAQDTGGAIKGRVRADFFWGFGAEAGALAGRMRSNGQMFLLWPRDARPALVGP